MFNNDKPFKQLYIMNRIIFSLIATIGMGVCFMACGDDEDELLEEQNKEEQSSVVDNQQSSDTIDPEEAEILKHVRNIAELDSLLVGMWSSYSLKEDHTYELQIHDYQYEPAYYAHFEVSWYIDLEEEGTWSLLSLKQVKLTCTKYKEDFNGRITDVKSTPEEIYDIKFNEDGELVLASTVSKDVYLTKRK